jgi:hypothetical protein
LLLASYKVILNLILHYIVGYEKKVFKHNLQDNQEGNYYTRQQLKWSTE